MPRVSVVIPTYRRPALLGHCLGAVLNQRFDRAQYEVIVVDDGHDDATQAAVLALAARHPGGPPLRYLRPAAGRGPAVARNVGWRAALGPVIAFTDDDTVPTPDWLAHGLAGLHGELAAVVGKVKVPPRPQPGKATAGLPTDHELMTRGLETAEFVTANVFVQRNALHAVGGFDERFARAWREDSDLQFRLEEIAPVGRADDAVVFHPVRHERWGISLRQQKNVFFDALLYKKHPRLYRERILSMPPWDYYAVVVLTIAAVTLWLADVPGSAIVASAIVVALVVRLALRRLRRTSHAPEHVLEMLLTSAAIPFLSVYWRLRGALHFRVLYL